MNAGFEYREEVGREAAGRTVIAWLAARYRHSSEAAWRERLAAGEVRIDGEVALATDLLRPGQSLAWRRPPWEEPTAPLSRSSRRRVTTPANARSGRDQY